MATYFGYVEREADSYVNWADVGRDLSNTIDDIQRVREEKKALLEKSFRDDLKFIADNPSGEHETLRAWSLNFGNNSAENLKIQNTLLKQGRLNVNDYVTFRQNLTDGVEKVYTVNQQLQDSFKKANDRTKAGENQQLERETKVLLEKYGELQNTETYIGPNGKVYLGLTEMVEEGGKSVRKLKKGAGSYLSTEQLQAAALQEFNKFDEQPVLDAWVEKTGKVQEDIRQIGGEALAGLITSVTDVTYERIVQIAKSLPEGQKLSPEQMAALEKYAKDFEAGESGFIDGVLGNPYDALSLLTETIQTNPKTGNLYNIVFNENDKKTSDDIYVEKTKEGNFNPKFDKEQIDAQKNYLKMQLNAKYDRKVEMQPYNEPQKPRPVAQGGGRFDEKAARYAGEQESKKEVADKILNLKVGDISEKESSLNYITGLKGVNQSKTKYDPSTNTLEVYSSDPDKPRPFVYQFEDLYDNNGKLIRKKTDMSNEDFVFQLLSIAYPDLEEEYSDYLSTVNKEKKENPNIPLSGTIRDKEKEIANLKKKRDEGGVASQEFYDIDIKAAEDELEKLIERQAAQKRQGQGQGRTSRFNE